MIRGNAILWTRDGVVPVRIDNVKYDLTQLEDGHEISVILRDFQMYLEGFAENYNKEEVKSNE